MSIQKPTCRTCGWKFIQTSWEPRGQCSNFTCTFVAKNLSQCKTQWATLRNINRYQREVIPKIPLRPLEIDNNGCEVRNVVDESEFILRQFILNLVGISVAS